MIFSRGHATLELSVSAGLSVGRSVSWSVGDIFDFRGFLLLSTRTRLGGVYKTVFFRGICDVLLRNCHIIWYRAVLYRVIPYRAVPYREEIGFDTRIRYEASCLLRLMNGYLAI